MESKALVDEVPIIGESLLKGPPSLHTSKRLKLLEDRRKHILLIKQNTESKN